jgi:hypothetical protein
MLNDTWEQVFGPDAATWDRTANPQLLTWPVKPPATGEPIDSEETFMKLMGEMLEDAEPEQGGYKAFLRDLGGEEKGWIPPIRIAVGKGKCYWVGRVESHTRPLPESHTRAGMQLNRAKMEQSTSDSIRALNEPLAGPPQTDVGHVLRAVERAHANHPEFLCAVFSTYHCSGERGRIGQIITDARKPFLNVISMAKLQSSRARSVCQGPGCEYSTPTRNHGQMRSGYDPHTARSVVIAGLFCDSYLTVTTLPLLPLTDTNTLRSLAAVIRPLPCVGQPLNGRYRIAVTMGIVTWPLRDRHSCGGLAAGSQDTHTLRSLAAVTRPLPCCGQPFYGRYLIAEIPLLVVWVAAGSQDTNTLRSLAGANALPSGELVVHLTGNRGVQQSEPDAPLFEPLFRVGTWLESITTEACVRSVYVAPSHWELVLHLMGNSGVQQSEPDAPLFEALFRVWARCCALL